MEFLETRCISVAYKPRRGIHYSTDQRHKRKRNVLRRIEHAENILMESALAPGKSEALDRLIMRVLQQGYGLLGGPWTQRATDVGDDIAVDRYSFQ